MLRKSALRRIMVTSLALFIFLVLSFFPNSIESEFHSTTTLDYPSKSAIYLLDLNEYVARTNVAMKSSDSLSKAKEIIDFLTIDSSKAYYIPNGFMPVLPKGTVLRDIALQNGILKLDFNQVFLNIPAEKIESVVECLIFSLTEIEGVEGLLLYVNGELLTTLPNTSIKLPDVLTRDYGVNKVYDVTNIQNVKKTTTYYASKYQDSIYYVPVTEITNNEKEKVEIIIERLKSSPIHQTNLISYLNANAELLDYEILENDVQLSFNRYLLDDFDKQEILEEVEYSIALSLKDTLHVDYVSFLVEGEKISDFHT